MNIKKILQSFLVINGLYYLYLSLLGLFFKENAAQYATDFFNFNLQVNSSTPWIVGLLATYMLFFTLIIFTVAYKPDKYFFLLYFILGFFYLRIAQRLYFILISNSNPELIVNTSAAYMHLYIIIISTIILTLLAFQFKKIYKK